MDMSCEAVRHRIDNFTALIERECQRSIMNLRTKVEYISHDIEQGYVLFRHKMHEDNLNSIGTMHGGLVATVLDSCMTCAGFIYSDNEVPVTQDMYIQYHNPVYLREEIYIRVDITRAGKRAINMNAKIYADDTVYATAMAVFNKIKAK